MPSEWLTGRWVGVRRMLSGLSYFASAISELPRYVGIISIFYKLSDWNIMICLQKYKKKLIQQHWRFCFWRYQDVPALRRWVGSVQHSNFLLSCGVSTIPFKVWGELTHAAMLWRFVWWEDVNSCVQMGPDVAHVFYGPVGPQNLPFWA